MPSANGDSIRLYLGTMTPKGPVKGAKGRGIYRFRLNLADGKLTQEAVTEVNSPSFLAYHPNGNYLYSVSEQPDGGGVVAYAIDGDTGDLTELNIQPSGGVGTTHLSVDPGGKYVVAAHYNSGGASLFPLNEDGSLGASTSSVQHEGSGPNKERQDGPHAHAAVATGNRVYVPDLGIDRVMIYRVDGNQLVPNDVPHLEAKPGSGPRHMEFHPNGQWAFLVCELDSTVCALGIDGSSGGLEIVQTVSTLPDTHTGKNTAAEVALTPDGRFAYVSNRGHDSVAIYAIDPANGHLALLGHRSVKGRTPRHIGIDPTGNFLVAANQDSDNLVVFRIDPETGLLRDTAERAHVSAPVCAMMR